MEISWQYLAGFIDGEGSIGTSSTPGSSALFGRVTVANTDHRLLRLLREQFGGSLNCRSIGDRPNWRPFGSLTWVSRGAAHVLTNTLPYLILKRPQAELCLELILMRQAPRKSRLVTVARPRQRSGVPGAGFWMVRPELRAEEMAIAERLKALNRKGVT